MKPCLLERFLLTQSMDQVMYRASEVGTFSVYHQQRMTVTSLFSLRNRHFALYTPTPKPFRYNPLTGIVHSFWLPYYGVHTKVRERRIGKVSIIGL